MACLLHVMAHPQPEQSQTVRIANAFVDSYREAHPDDTMETLDLYAAGVPHLGPAHTEAMLQQGAVEQMAPAVAEAWHEIIGKVAPFTAADKYLVTTPTWNFGVPSILKAYVDHLVLAGHTFQFTGPGASVGLLTGRTMALITTRGGIYSQPPMDEYEMCLRYLRHVFGFLGIEITAEIVAEGLALVGPHEQEKIMQPAIARAREAAQVF